jgi:tetratricopeptide (TPR) repeat protein
MRNILRKLSFLIIAIPLVCLFAVLLYQLPPVHDRLYWRLDNLRAQIDYTLHPPEKQVFIPQEQVDAIVKATLAVLLPTPSLTPSPSPTLPGDTATPLPSPTPSPSPTPLPPSIQLKGVVHEYQKWNNCGPATLAMALSYWGWKGDQRDTAAVLKPNPRDKNVMPYEMQSYVEDDAGLKAAIRYGGDLDTLKRFIAAGFPVVVEKGFEVPKEGWMGHYEVLTGYNDVKQAFTAQDSYIGPDLPVKYTELAQFWRHFDYIFLVIYPAERESEVMALLGPLADETASFQAAALKASNEIYSLEGRELFFAWYNRGTSLVKLQDYAGAAQAYDRAWTLYANIPEKERPWRMLWYQTGPYFAYYYTGRYWDVINLATSTIDYASEPAIEESFYWRGMARLSNGDTSGAIDDFKETLIWHPDFQPGLAELQQLGMQP